MHQNENSKVVYLRPKKKKSLKPWFLTALFLFIAIAMYCYTRPIYHIVDDGTLEEGFSREAVIIKNETIITSPGAGKLQLLVEAGERVRVGTPLFIVSTDEVEKALLEEEIAQLEDQISEILNSDTAPLSLNVLHYSTEDITKKLKDAISKGEFDKAISLRDELERLTEEKLKYEALEDENLHAFESALENLRAKLSQIDLMISAPVSGIVSFNIDGLENQWPIHEANNQASPSAAGSGKRVNPPSKVAAGTPILKIVDNFSWHLVLDVPKDLQKGWYYNIFLEDTGEKVRAKLVELNEDQGKGTFYIGVDLKDLVDLRKIDVRVSTRTYSGKIIPMEAVFDDQGTPGVYAMTPGGKKFKPIEIIFEDGGQAIVDGVKLGDKLLLAKKGFRFTWRQ